MIHKLKYINSLGEEIVFGGEICETPWRFGKTNLFDIELDYEQLGGRITSFDPGTREFDLRIWMTAGMMEDRNRLEDIFAYDNRVVAHGVLYAGESYIKIYRKAGSMSDWQYEDGMMTADLTLVSDEPYWIREITTTLTQEDVPTVGGLDYPHDYPHDYLYSSGMTTSLTNPFRLPAKCRIVFPGPCVNPYVIIGPNRYQVMESARKGQLIVVEGYGDKRIYVRGLTGGERDIWSAGVREEGARIFAPVPVGDNIVGMSGAYNVEVTLYEERYSPWQS